MKRTFKDAAVKAPHNYWVNRRVWADDDGVEFIKINGTFVSIEWLRAHGWKVDIAF